MNFVVAYDVATSYSESQLEYRLVADDSAVARIFATSERAWFGEVVDGDAIGPPACEPGYALLVAHGDRGRPEERPRPAQLALTELYEADALLAERARARGAAVIAMRVLRRKPAAEPGWPPEARVLRAETLAHPDDDGPRLVFADALESKRGTLVIVQCDLARTGLTPPESRARRRSQRDLLAKHGAAWSRLDGLASRCAFRRGFVETVEVRAGSFAFDQRHIFDAAPHVRCVAFATSANGFPPRELFELPAFRRLTGAYFDAYAAHTALADLSQLRAFGIARLLPRMAHELVARTRLANLEILRLDGHALGPDALAALVRDSPALRVLDAAAGPSIAPAIPPSVRELHVDRQTPLEALAALPAAPLLQKLRLMRSDLRACGETLGAFSALRSLDVLDAVVDGSLARAALPALRELRLPVWLAPEAIAAIARAFGPQLELLDVRGNAHVRAVADELRALVIGDVWLGTAELRRPLMPASYLPDEPMWDVGSVDLG